MPNCAFLTMDNLDDFEVYDELLQEPMADLGWSVEMVSWRTQKVDWDRYEVVIIRSPWDYQQDVEGFIEVLKDIHKSSARLENPLSLVLWNIDKTYLRDLETDGIRIVPTLWGEQLEYGTLDTAYREFEVDELIIKPTVSANADNTFRLPQDSSTDLQNNIIQVFSKQAYMIQPFMRGIVEEGEYSLFYFGGNYSHTILKKPGTGDFRVQEEHGGSLHSVDPEEQLLYRARQTMDLLKPQPLYARADYVRTQENDFALMELELIEPSLYFNMDADSPRRFARIFDEWMKKLQ
jgi:hypothetical protein